MSLGTRLTANYRLPSSIIPLYAHKGMTNAAHRVARRYQAAVLRDKPIPEIVFSDEGVISAADIKRFLEPHIGTLFQVRLRPSLVGLPNTIAWEPLSENAEFITGRVVLHAKVDETRISVWAEVLVDQRGALIRIASALPRQLLQDRLREVADKARRLVQEVRVRPGLPAQAIVDDLQELLEIAEVE